MLAALRRAHVVADRTWGLLQVLEGAVVFAAEVTPPFSAHLAAGDQQPIPPGVVNRLRVDEPVRLPIDVLIKPALRSS